MENASFTSAEDDKQDYQEELLLDFPDEERTSIFKVRLAFFSYIRATYFKGKIIVSYLFIIKIKINFTQYFNDNYQFHMV